MARSKWLMRLALVAVFALVAAACGGDDEEEGQPAGGADEACAADEFGCVEYAEGEAIKVGTLLAISGDVAFLGTDSVHGVELAIDNLDGTLDGTNGQILGHDVTIVQEDDLCSADGGQAGGTRLAADPTIVAVIGTSCSSSALGVADTILSEKGISLISPSNTNPNLTAEGTHQPFYMRTAHNDKIQGAIVAAFLADELGLTSMATINDESPYADALAAVARQVFEGKGGTITAVEAIQSTDTDFTPLLTRIAEGDPDVLYFPDFNPACALIAQQAQGILPEDTVLIGSDGCSDPSFGEIAGPAADGVYYSGPDVTAFQQADFYKATFLPAYEDLAGSAPTAAFHAHAYDAMGVLAQAIEAVGIEEGGSLFIPRTALRDALLGTSGYEGITGTVTCNPLGDCAAAIPIAVFQIPNDPAVSGNTDAEPVFSQLLTLEEAEALVG